MGKKRLHTPLIVDFQNGGVRVNNIDLKINYPDVKIWVISTDTKRFEAHHLTSFENNKTSHEIWLVENESSLHINTKKRRFTTKFFLNLDQGDGAYDRWIVSVGSYAQYETRIVAFKENPG